MQNNINIAEQLPFVLEGTDLKGLGTRYVGKVRDNYIQDEKRILITTDRLSCFDKVVTSVPFKGQVLQTLASYWFKHTADIVPNHVISIPDPQVVIGRQCEVLPIEVVVRGYLAGSAWRDYQAGKSISGVALPPGMRRSQKLAASIITPSTKAAMGDHDIPISESDLLAQKLVAPDLWSRMRSVALELFERASSMVAERGLLLADTKYEFGLHKGELMLVDEIHTLDSSRYWVAETYIDRFERGEDPQMLDKEPTRQWLLSQGFKGDGLVPHFSDQHRCEIAQHYINSCQRITGEPLELQIGSVLARITKALKL